MTKRKNLAVLSNAAIGTLVLSALSSTAYAKADAYLVKDIQSGKYYEYNLNELVESMVDKTDLYKQFSDSSKTQLIAIHDDKLNAYVHIDKITDALVDEEEFNLDNFTETRDKIDQFSVDAKVTNLTTDENGKVVEVKKEVETELKVESVSAITNSTLLNVTFSEATKADKLEGKKLLLEVGENKVEANFKSLSEDGKVAAFVFDEKTAEGTYIVSSKDFSIKADTKVLFDKTAPTVNPKESKFIDYKTMKITFSEKVIGTPVVKVNGTAVDTKNVAFAKDEMSLEVKNEEGFKAGTYSVSIEGLKDIASNDMAADSTTKVVKEASKVTKAKITTEKLATKQSTIAVSAVDQYGETIVANKNVKIKAFNGTMPVDEKETDERGFALIKSDALVKDANIKLELFAKDKDGKYTVKVGEKTLVVFQEISKAASIDSIERTDSNKDKEIKVGDSIELTANVSDQFGNKMLVVEWKNKDEDAAATQRQLRWTTDNKEVIAFAGAETKDFKDGEAGKTTIGLMAKGNGDATVTAYLPDGSASKTFKLSVVDGQLAQIDATGVSVEAKNKAKLKKANVTVNEKDEEGKVLKANTLKFFNKKDNSKKDIPVKADSVNFEIVAPQGFEAKDVNIEKVTDENGNLTGLKITSNRTELTADEKAGKYETGVVYTIKVKSNVKEVAEANFNFTSKIDSEVKTISDIKFKENELTAKGTVQKVITFENQYGEKLNVIAKSVKMVSSNKENLPEATKLTTDVKGEFVESKKENTDILTGLEFKPTTEGTYKVLITIGVTSKQIEVPVAKAAGIKEVQLGTSSVDVIANDKLDAEKASDKDNIVVDEDITYTLIPINFADQYGNKVDVKGNSDIKLSKVENNTEDKNQVQNVKIKLFKDLKTVAKNNEKENVKYIGIAATDKQEGDIYVTYSEGGKVVTSAPLTVNVKEARKINSITVDNKQLALALEGKGTVKVVTKDQYGRLFKTENIKVTANPLTVVEVSKATEDNDVKHNFIGYKFDVTAKGFKGNVTLTVKADDKTETVNVSVDAAGKLIDKVKIDENDIKPLYSTEKPESPAVQKGIQLKAVATDKDGREVPVPEKGFTWEVVSVDGTIEDKKADKNAVTIKEKENVIKAVQKFKGKAIIKVTTANGKSNTITLNFSNAPAKFNKLETVKEEDKLVIDKTIDEDATKEGIQIIFGKADTEENSAKDKTVTLTIGGNTQYGEIEKAKDAIVLVADPTVVKVDNPKLKNDGKLELTAAGSGSTEVYVTINGETLTLDVSVEGLVAKELDEKNTEAQALSESVAEFKLEVDKYKQNNYENKSWQTFDGVIKGKKKEIYENGTDGELKNDLKSDIVNKAIKEIQDAATKLVTKE
ncbi:hypothetical protein [Clostridium haemolyticum]|uniref:S-layer protein n=1 Tax=Clostridium haemolyticum NCTC 9693 TaxID=1443114 RepID=A0ABR4TFH4_CLOHA|nr:hypothetical protein [Clostridium haemolyticum]KEI16749.1 hypothetical protein Z960_08375 [Clostridium haemolyticum NCTC 9693]KGN04694.1 hypothetical protein Z961_01465 [Clostridium haemolyticum NCTC 8350]